MFYASRIIKLLTCLCMIATFLCDRTRMANKLELEQLSLPRFRVLPVLVFHFIIEIVKTTLQGPQLQQELANNTSDGLVFGMWIHFLREAI